MNVQEEDGLGGRGKRVFLRNVVFAIGVLVAGAGTAQAADARWEVSVARFHGTRVSGPPLLDAVGGWEFAGAAAVAPRLTLTAGLFGNEILFEPLDGGTLLTVKPTWLLAGINYRLTENSPVEVVAGPLVGWLRIEHASLEGDGTARTGLAARGASAWGAQLRAGLELGGRVMTERHRPRSMVWAGVAYMRSRPEIETPLLPHGLALDHRIYRLGYTIRF